MSVACGTKWNIVETYNASPGNSNAALAIGIATAGGDFGGTFQNQVWSKGVQLYSGAAVRSYCVSSYRQTAGTWSNIANARLDVYGSTTDATSLNTFLNNMATGDLLVLSTYDEPATNKSYFDTNLRDNFGAQVAASAFEVRCLYLLVAVKGRKLPIYERYERRFTAWFGASLWTG